MNQQTICAISTPIGNGGIAIIRISGEKAFDVLQKMVELDVKSLNNRELTLCKINTDSFSEQALVVIFKAPNSYTGENLVEIQCHGGIILTETILNQCVKMAQLLQKQVNLLNEHF